MDTSIMHFTQYCQFAVASAPLFMLLQCAQASGPPSPPEGKNRLALEQSPYLLQHSENPVDWYPWGEEAFALARKLDKPVFLSIGYATCHWCHVMEHESFEDAEAAALLNDAFVCIKVDREERPDIDQVYMQVCQVMTGSGGWPLTVIMTPDKQPFFAGTYFPKSSRFGRPGLMELIPQVTEVWKTRRDELMTTATRIIEELNKAAAPSDGAALSDTTLQFAYQQFDRRFDAVHGGFGTAPKFPTPHNLTFLLRYHDRSGEARALQMVEKTLTAMRYGGMYDHIGFGFHRYSTDPTWLVPHFEKMLYDQAMLTLAYTETFQVTRNPFYRRTAEEICTYVLRDMTAPEGGFYSAEDADSEGVEGLCYLWSLDELHQTLQDIPAETVETVYNIKADGNFQAEAPGMPENGNIPHMTEALEETAETLSIPVASLREQMEQARVRLLEKRNTRIPPLKDDKILCDWNGLMIAAFAVAGRTFDRADYIEAAEKAALFIRQNMRDANGRLLHRYRNGEARHVATCEDYAFLTWGLLELYESTFKAEYLDWARTFTDDMVEHFWDDQGGGFFFTADDSEELLVRSRDLYDGATPSGNSVAALNLVRLSRILADVSYEEKADRIGKAFAGQIDAAPYAFSQFLHALDFTQGPSREIIIAGNSGAADTRTMLQQVQHRFDPRKILLFRPLDEKNSGILKLASWTKDYTGLDGQATAYVCRDYVCSLPTSDPAKLEYLLEQK